MPADVEVVALPENVIADIVLPSAEILLSTKTAVPAKPVEDLEPNRYNVFEVSVVVLITCAEVAVPVRFAVIVPAEKLPEPSLKTIVELVFDDVALELTVKVAFSAAVPIIEIPEPDACTFDT